MRLRSWGLRLVGAALLATLVTILAWILWPEERETVKLSQRTDESHVVAIPPASIVESKNSSTGTVGAAHRAAKRWYLQTASDRLDEIFLSARSSTDVEERYAALKIASICQTLPKDVPSEKAAAVFEDDVARRKVLIEQVSVARATLREFCAEGDSDAYLADVREKRVAVNGPSSAISRQSRSSNAKLDQWGTLILSNPQEYSAGFEVWLEIGVPRILPDQMRQDPRLVQAVRTQLYQSFLGPSPEDSIRTLHRCAVSFRCDEGVNLTSEQKLAVNASAMEIERRIRQQRWDELAPGGR